MKAGLNVTKLMALALFVWAAGTQAQITVTSTDVLGLIGKTHEVETDTTFSVSVNVGSAGANQTWDFRSVTIQAERYTNQFVNRQGTPFAAQFPQANFVQKTTFPAEPGSEFYLYLQVTSASAQTVGSGVITPDTSFANPQVAGDITPLPLQFGATWNEALSDTFGDPQTFAIITTSNTSNTVDGWGQVRLPIGDFDCLRIRGNSETITKTIFSGTVFLADTTTTIDYIWISKNNFYVAMAVSQDGETNPNFTEAASFSRLASTTTSVASHSGREAIPEAFELSQNFPNPFNPETKIAFQLRQAGVAELSVFNVTGEKMRTLLSAPMPAGEHTVTWDGRDASGRNLASGVYVYRLKVGNHESAKTMLLLK